MHDVLVLILVCSFGLIICSSIVIGLRWLGRKVESSTSVIAIRLRVEFDFMRFAKNLEDELGQLSAAHYGMIEGWPKERMKQAIQEEQDKYSMNQAALFSKYKRKFKDLDEQCSSMCPDFIQGLIELNAETYPTLGKFGQIFESITT